MTSDIWVSFLSYKRDRVDGTVQTFLQFFVGFLQVFTDSSPENYSRRRIGDGGEIFLLDLVPAVSFLQIDVNNTKQLIVR